MKIEKKLVKFGNSRALVIPIRWIDKMSDKLGLKTPLEAVRIEEEEDRLVVYPIYLNEHQAEDAISNQKTARENTHTSFRDEVQRRLNNLLAKENLTDFEAEQALRFQATIERIDSEQK